MATEKVIVNGMVFTVKPGDGFFTVWFRYKGTTVASEVSVHFTAAGIEVIEDRSNASELWTTKIAPSRSGGYKVETTGGVERMGSLTEVECADSAQEYRDMRSFEQRDARVFSAIKLALQAISALDSSQITTAQQQLLRTYSGQFLNTELQKG